MKLLFILFLFISFPAPMIFSQQIMDAQGIAKNSISKNKFYCLSGASNVSGARPGAGYYFKTFSIEASIGGALQYEG